MSPILEAAVGLILLVVWGCGLLILADWFQARRGR